MSILTPSTTPTTRQVWPPTDDTPYGRYHLRTPVALDELAVGDVVSFIGEDRRSRPVIREGEVVEFGELNGRRRVAQVQTRRGRCMLSRKNWRQRAPRR